MVTTVPYVLVNSKLIVTEYPVSGFPITGPTEGVAHSFFKGSNLLSMPLYIISFFVQRDKNYFQHCVTNSSPRIRFSDAIGFV